MLKEEKTNSRNKNGRYYRRNRHQQRIPQNTMETANSEHGFDQHSSYGEFDKCHRMLERSSNYRGDCHGYDQQNYHYEHRPFNDRYSRRDDARP